MATVIGSTPCLTVDANVAVALSAKEADKYETAKRELWKYARDGYQFYAPGVIVAECLFVFCKKLAEGSLSPADHADAVADFSLFMRNGPAASEWRWLLGWPRGGDQAKLWVFTVGGRNLHRLGRRVGRRRNRRDSDFRLGARESGEACIRGLGSPPPTISCRTLIEQQHLRRVAGVDARRASPRPVATAGATGSLTGCHWSYPTSAAMVEEDTGRVRNSGAWRFVANDSDHRWAKTWGAGQFALP